MREPRFWYRDSGWQSNLLRPLGWLYAFLTARRVARAPQFQADIPVVCIGNINAGGTGKTPTVIAIAQRLSDQDIAAHIVTRGYGGDLSGPIRVDETHHTADQTGDEPLLLAAFAPTWVSKDRAAGVNAAQDDGAQIVLLDDGFQNPTVAKDLSIVVVDGTRGFGNGQVIPSGPLREPANVGLKRADLVISIGGGVALPDQEAPIVTGSLRPLATGMPWQNMPVFAFAGIGNPEKFFQTLRDIGTDVKHTRALDDHQPLSAALMRRLEQDAKAANTQLVTTEKDAVRLPTEFRTKVLTLPVRLDLDDWAPLDAKLSALGLQSSSD